MLPDDETSTVVEPLIWPDSSQITRHFGTNGFGLTLSVASFGKPL